MILEALRIVESNYIIKSSSYNYYNNDNDTQYVDYTDIELLIDESDNNGAVGLEELYNIHTSLNMLNDYCKKNILGSDKFKGVNDLYIYNTIKEHTIRVALVITTKDTVSALDIGCEILQYINKMKQFDFIK